MILSPSTNVEMAATAQEYRAPSDFSQAEWLALFPWPAKDRGAGLPPDDEGALPEPAEAQYPLDARSVAAALAPWPHLRRLSQFQRSTALLTVGSTNLWMLVRLAAATAASCALLALTVVESGGRFGLKQTIAFAVTFWGGLWVAILQSSPQRPGKVASWNYDSDPLAGFIRWRQLVAGDLNAEAGVPGSPAPCDADEDCEKDGGRSGRDSVLLQHWEGDDKCPCTTCLADLGPSILRQLVALIALHILTGGWAAWLLSSWTPLVTMGSKAWYGPWAVAGVILVIHIAVTWYPVEVLALRSTRCSGVMTPTLRLLRRAVAANLMSVLDVCRGAADNYDRHISLLIQLRHRLGAAGAVRLSAVDAHTRGWIFVSMTFVLSVIVVAAVGGCITAGSIASIGALFGIFSFDIYLAAYSNGLASDAGKLYDAALVRLREWRARDYATMIIDPAHAERIARVESLLRSYRDVAGLQATLLGFPITFQVVRTFLVTTVTVAIGLWSLLRGAGLFFTIESICPSY
ncbi:hypothetical protein DFJ74DRAFT_496845 [Hyaloraphidium curvatum]|nr:hypothetical protein DFJ74DRAFT_496845 [Hyaloraphidium curvatum]